MYRFLLIAGLLGLLWYLLRRAIVARRQSGGWLSRDKNHFKENHMVQDPVCRVFIPRANALRQEIGGQAYFFCSQDCAKVFQKQLSG
jgi:YHS domain-containing protein